LDQVDKVRLIITFRGEDVSGYTEDCNDYCDDDDAPPDKVRHGVFRGGKDYPLMMVCWTFLDSDLLTFTGKISVETGHEDAIST